MKIEFFVPKIPFSLRLIIFTLCEGTGLLIQLFFPSLLLLSIIIMICGALFIAAKNYKNKPIDLGFEDWKPAALKEFRRIEENLKMTKEISYPFLYKNGFGIFLLVVFGIISFFAFVSEEYHILIIVLDLFIIFFPVSRTGLVKLWTPAQLTMKMNRFKTVLDEATGSPDDLIITPYLRLDKDKEGRQIPEDVRLMLEPRRKPGDFVGVQLQVAINNGPHGAVPYMYSVFLCKGKGESYRILRDMSFGSMIKEPGGDEEYGYIVVRQKTSGSGYHTDPGDCQRLFAEVKKGLQVLS
jgi:hypothetical protein